MEFLDAWWPELTPRGVLAAMADERRLGRWSRRILNQGEIRRLARSLKRLGADGDGPLSVHDVALLDELETLLGSPAAPEEAARPDPLDQLTGLEELMPQREESQRRAGRAAGGGAYRVRARHRRRGAGPHAHAVADGRPPRPARHLDGRRRRGPVVLVRPGRGRRGPRRGARQPSAPPLHPDRELPQPGGDRRAGGQGARPRHARAWSRRGRCAPRAYGRGSVSYRTADLAADRTGGGAAAAGPGGRHGRGRGRDAPARAGGALAGRARRPGGGAGQPGGQGAGVRRDGRGLARRRSRTSPRRACGCCTWRSPGRPSSSRWSRRPATSRTRREYRTCSGIESRVNSRAEESLSGVVC